MSSPSLTDELQPPPIQPEQQQEHEQHPDEPRGALRPRTTSRRTKSSRTSRPLNSDSDDEDDDEPDLHDGNTQRQRQRQASHRRHLLDDDEEDDEDEDIDTGRGGGSSSSAATSKKRNSSSSKRRHTSSGGSTKRKASSLKKKSSKRVIRKPKHLYESDDDVDEDMVDYDGDEEEEPPASSRDEDVEDEDEDEDEDVEMEDDDDNDEDDDEIRPAKSKSKKKTGKTSSRSKRSSHSRTPRPQGKTKKHSKSKSTPKSSPPSGRRNPARSTRGRHSLFENRDDENDDLLASDVDMEDQTPRKSSTSPKESGDDLIAPSMREERVMEKIIGRRLKQTNKPTDGDTAPTNESPEAESAAGPATDSTPAPDSSASKDEDKPDASTSATNQEPEAPVELEYEYLVKWKKLSHIHCEWVGEDVVLRQAQGKSRLKRFMRKQDLADIQRGSGEHMNAEADEDELIPEDFVTVDRILSDRINSEGTIEYLVKWCSLSYMESTWEVAEDVKDDNKISQYRNRNTKPPEHLLTPPPRPEPSEYKLLPMPRFRNGGALRDYQMEGFNWLVSCWYNRQGCILADEMGLGKTIQSVSFLNELFVGQKIRGPFLVLAPLSTLGHWQREFETWTEMNAVVFHGSTESRRIITQHEWSYGPYRKDPPFKWDVIITTYETILQEANMLRPIVWKAMVVDEAHRLKNRASRLVDELVTFKSEHRVLLTGTPIQNNSMEVWALLNFLEPAQFMSEDEFAREFGDIKDADTVDRLKALLRPFLLRRLKEDVEKSIPPKEETVISVELTHVQKKWYKAMLEQNFSFLDKGGKSNNVGNLRNIVMELRKCCNHPYLIKGVEDIESSNLPPGADRAAHMKHLVSASGKMVLVDKLLPSLKKQGHRVLIFSQMIRVLDILEDYLLDRRWGYERIDGRVRGNDRQQAIDRFSKPDSEKFVFLLCTRAGGQGINLTCADTVIIYDSDWNPQNDVQAQARCHRIGQKTKVKIYRLITRNTYEEKMFDRASKKLGLDQAILQNMGKTESLLAGNHTSGKKNKNVSLLNEMNRTDIDSLLKKGAYDVFNENDSAADAFTAEDIHEILERRTRVVSSTAANAGPSEFSKASFRVDQGTNKGPEIQLDDPDFWKKLMPEASAAPDPNIEVLPRRRRQTVRYQPKLGSDDSDLDEEISGDEGPAKLGPNGKRLFNKGERHRVQRALCAMGWGRWYDILEKAGLADRRDVDDVAQFCKALMRCVWEALERNLNEDPKGSSKASEVRKRLKAILEDAQAPHRSIIGHKNRKHRSKSDSANGKKAKDGSVADDDGEESEDMESDSEVEGSCDEYGNILGPVNPEFQNFTDPILVAEDYDAYLSRNAQSIMERMELLNCIRRLYKDGSLSEGSEIPSVGASGSQALDDWWDASFDRDLLRGTFKHGFGSHRAILEDPELCFHGRVMPPMKNTTKEASSGNNGAGSESEGSENKRKKKKRKLDPDGKGHEDNADMSSDSEDEKNADEEKLFMLIPEEEFLTRKWPAVNVLNVRVRKLIRGFERLRKRRERVAKQEEEHEKSRRLKEEKRIAREKQQEEHAAEKSRKQAEANRMWTKKEKQDFCKYFCSVGAAPLDNTGKESWPLVKTRAGLPKKEPEQIAEYAREFMEMCDVALLADQWVKKHKSTLAAFFNQLGPKPDGGPSRKKSRVPFTLQQMEDGRVTVVNARKFRERHDIITTLRQDILCELNEEGTKKLIEKKGGPSAKERLPDWWRENRVTVDLALLTGIATHGFDPQQTGLDESLPFRKLLAQNVLDYINETLNDHKQSGPDFNPDSYVIPKNISEVAEADILTFFPKDRMIISRLRRLIDTLASAHMHVGAIGAAEQFGRSGAKLKTSKPLVPKKRSISPDDIAPSGKVVKGAHRGRGTMKQDGSLVMSMEDSGALAGAIPCAFENVPTERMTRKLLKFLKQQKKMNSNQVLKLSLPDWTPVETEFVRVNADGTEFSRDGAKPAKRRRVTGNGSNSQATGNSVGKKESGKKDVIVKKVDSMMHKVERDEDGNIVFPIRLGVLTIECLGSIDSNRRLFHTERAIYPIGFKSIREYTSMVDISRQCKYVCEILDDGGNAPVFQVTCLDGDKPVRRDSSSSACWTYVMTAIRDASPDDRKRLHTTVSGPEYFGLSNALVQELIQGLEGAELCERYVMKQFVPRQKPEVAAAAAALPAPDEDDDDGAEADEKMQEAEPSHSADAAENADLEDADNAPIRRQDSFESMELEADDR